MKTVEETNRTLLDMYEWKDNVVNQSRKRARKVNKNDEQEREEFRIELENFLEEDYDDEVFSKMNKMFLQFVMNFDDTDWLYSVFTNENGSINECEVENYYFMFRETIHWYDMSEYK